MNQVNAGGQMMRDTSNDYQTGWLQNGNYYDMYHSLAYGFAGLGELGQVVAAIPEAGRKHVEAALADPEAKPYVMKCLESSDPVGCILEQVERDLAEVVNPTGKPIVFKSIAQMIGPKLKAVEEALVDALPTEDTEEGREALEIIGMSDNPEKALELYYTQIAMEELAPDAFPEESSALDAYDDEDEAMDGIDPFGLGMSAKGKRILKTAAIGVGVAAAAVGAVVAGPAILGAIGSVGSAVMGGVKSIFGGGAPAPGAPTTPEGEEYIGPVITGQPGATPTPQRPAFDISTIADAAVKIYAAKRAGGTSGDVMYADLVRQMVAAGMGQSEAAALVNQALAQAAQMYAGREPSEAPSYAPSFAPSYAPTPGMPEIPDREEPAKAGLFEGTGGLILAGALAFLVAGQLGGGRRK